MNFMALIAFMKSSGLMFLITLVCVIILSILLRAPIRKYAWAFYAVSAAIVLVYLFNFYEVLALPYALTVGFLTPLIGSCLISWAMFIVVMFIGVLPRNCKPYIWLKPIRGELSIIAWIFALGHMVVYLLVYLPRIFTGQAVKLNLIVSIAVAVILFILLMVLGITSFNFVKTRMKAASWKRLQKWAYLFFALVYVHLMIILLWSAAGGTNAWIKVSIYSVIFVAYVALRFERAKKDKEIGAETQADIEA